MNTVLSIAVVALSLVSLSLWLRLRRQRKMHELELDALSATPADGDRDVSGFWTAYQPTDMGDVVSRVRLSQHGKTVRGWMQCKFAAAHPLEIRGILTGDRLIASYWRPDRYMMGSGVLSLTLEPEGNVLTGHATWNSAGKAIQEEHSDVRLERCAT
jgi:hypothetical protein